MRDLPAHQQHQEKPEQHEAQRDEAVLDADDFVVGGENVFAPETRLVVFVSGRGRRAPMPCMPGSRNGRKLLNECFHVI